METITIFCIDCGAANPEEAKFCFACGQVMKRDGKVSSHAEQIGQLKTGNVLRQRYQIQSQIGQGGFGAVYKAEDSELGQRLVAVKEMSYQKRSVQEIQDGIETFKREALMLAGLKHEHLPHIYEHFSENDHWYLVMDYIEGETLENRFEKSRDGSLPLVMALQIALQLCNVLEYLHTRQPPIIFRDLKPSNIILTPEGSLFLIDFGIARHFKPGQAKDTIAFGSPGYAAPEQYGKAQTTPRADIYSLGSILHQMLSGHDPSLSPFRYAPLTAHNPILQQLILRMLEMDENARPASISEVKQSLRAVREQPVQPPLNAVGPLNAGQLVSAIPSSQRYLAISQPGIAGSPGAPLQVHHHHYGVVRAVAWSPDSSNAASATDAIVRVWDASNGKNICSYQEHRGNIKQMAWSPLGTQIASVSEENKVRIWDAQNGNAIFTYPGIPPITRTLAWSRDGRFLAVAGGSHIAVWDTDKSMIVEKLNRSRADFTSISWAPDGKSLAVTTDNRVLVWKIDAPKRINIRMYRYATRVNIVAWSPDGIYLASGGNDRAIHVWDISNERLVGVYRYHLQSVTTLSWAPDSRRIVSGGFSEYINVWDAITGWHIISYYAHAGMAMALAWSPNGKAILSGGSDRRVCVWRAP
jgi:serine/threonine protein kinase